MNLTETEKVYQLALAEYHTKGYDVDMSKITLGEVYERWIKRLEPKVKKNAARVIFLVFDNFIYSSNKKSAMKMSI